MTLIDSHCHIDFNAFDSDRKQGLEHCLNQGIEHIVVPGVSQHLWQQQLHICHQYPQLLPALGLHPLFLQHHATEHLPALEKAIEQFSPIAVGEIGLDFYHGKQTSETQLSLFTAQLKLAKKYDLPVILHVRKAHDETLKQLRQFDLIGGIVHAFSGSEQQAYQYIELGFKLGIGGALTYERANKLHKLFSKLPASAIVLETDAPDMPLSGKQGQRNSPEYLPDVLHKLAEVRSESKTQLADITTHNSQSVFRLK